MASKRDFVEYVAEQLREAGTITYKPMFGEYGLYCNGKYFAVICENRFLVKITPAGKALLPNGVTDLPYPGGSPMFLIEDLENTEFLKTLTQTTCAALPQPKRRKNTSAPSAPEQTKEPYDFVTAEKAFYQPTRTPAIVDIPAMTFLMVDGKGDPNDPNGAYHHALQLLYTLSYTIKMSAEQGHPPAGYYDYVVPPLESLWWTEHQTPFSETPIAQFCWTSLVRQPDFVTPDVFAWACDQVERENKGSTASARLETWTEGLCVQCLHIGGYYEEAPTLSAMNEILPAHGCIPDWTAQRKHHEVYLSDPRETPTEQLKTVLRTPIKRV